MDFDEMLDQYAQKMATVYDLAALCYDYIIQTVGNQANFLGKYVFEGDGKTDGNPNINAILAMSNSAVGIFYRVWQGAEFAECMSELRILVKTTTRRLVDYGEKTRNKAVIPFWLLKSIDRYVEEVYITQRRVHGETEPLNNGYCQKSYIYVRGGRMMIEEAAEELEFPTPISTASIKNQFRNLVILEKAQLQEGASAPKIVELLIDENDTDRAGIIWGKQLKVAVIPSVEADMLEFPYVQGGCFRVTYKDEKRKTMIARAIFLLERAIDAGANIILYPEFVCDRQTQEAIGERLAELYSVKRKRVKNLLLVLAGSRWDPSDNNIAVWYSYKGRKLGEYYKYCGFYKQQDEHHGSIEHLTDPGRENTIIYVDGLGLIQAGICRDVSDTVYMPSLTNAFVPALLFVPAWSKSINIGFRGQLEKIASENRRTSSVICNCCEAVRDAKKFKEEVGMFVSPMKMKSRVTGKAVMLKRTKDYCAKRCLNTGCFFMLELDYSTGAVKSGKVLKKCSQLC